MTCTSRIVGGLASSFLVGVLAACGGKAAVPDGAGGTGGGGGAAGTGGSGASECSYYAPPGTFSPVTLRVLNQTGVDLFLGDPEQSCGSPRLFSLMTIGGGGTMPVGQEHLLDICEPTCEQLQHSGCACAADCAMPAVIRVIPGGSYELSWPGYVLGREPMPAECFHDPTCHVAGSTCPITRDPPATLSVAVQGYDYVDCDGSPCTCEPDSTGSCMAWAGAPQYGEPTFYAKALWNEGQQVVELVFVPG